LQSYNNLGVEKESKKMYKFPLVVVLKNTGINTFLNAGKLISLKILINSFL